MLIKKKYLSSPPCPRCGSHQTGYKCFCQTQKECNEKIYKGLLNGELVEASLNTDDIYNDTNLFCKSCGSRWFGEVEVKFLTFEERMEQRKERGITDEVIKEYSIMNLSLFERLKAQRNLKKQKKKLEKNKIKKAKKVKKEVRIKK